MVESDFGNYHIYRIYQKTKNQYHIGTVQNCMYALCTRKLYKKKLASNFTTALLWILFKFRIIVLKNFIVPGTKVSNELNMTVYHYNFIVFLETPEEKHFKSILTILIPEKMTS